MTSQLLEIKTISGQPASILGLGSRPGATVDVEAAYAAGVNYFFFYNLNHRGLVEGLHPLLASGRQNLLVATGSSTRNMGQLRQYLDEVREELAIEVIDLFFAEYVSPSDDMAQVQAVLEELHRWQAAGWIRYVGASTHSRPLALALIEGGQCQVLMHRYNMAHRKAEADVLPAAYEAGIPVVAFTCTRWGSLLKGHPDWQGGLPQAMDCYRYALQHPAVRLALMAPKTKAELVQNLDVLETPDLSPETVEQLQAFGDLIYGDGRNSFETDWP